MPRTGSFSTTQSEQLAAADGLATADGDGRALAEAAAVNAGDTPDDAEALDVGSGAATIRRGSSQPAARVTAETDSNNAEARRI